MWRDMAVHMFVYCAVQVRNLDTWCLTWVGKGGECYGAHSFSREIGPSAVTHMVTRLL